MSASRCLLCAGSGRLMGGGMIYKDCDDCGGKGKIISLEIVMQKDSSEYKSSLEKIKLLDDNMTNEQAKKLLDDELNKIDREEKIVPLKEKRKK